MDTLYRSQEDLIPEVVLDKEKRIFRIIGTSCPLDPFEFYQPVYNWIERYIEYPLEETVFELNLNYFNTASAKFLLMIISKLNKLTKSGKKVKIIWYYSEFDEDMLEEGEEFKSLTDIDFQLVSIKSKDDDDDDFDFL